MKPKFVIGRRKVVFARGGDRLCGMRRVQTFTKRQNKKTRRLTVTMATVFTRANAANELFTANTMIRR